MSKPLPVAIVYIRISQAGADVGLSEGLRDELVNTVKAYATTWAVRVKRRKIDEARAEELMDAYEHCNKLHIMIE